MTKRLLSAAAFSFAALTLLFSCGGGGVTPTNDTIIPEPKSFARNSGSFTIKSCDISYPAADSTAREAALTVAEMLGKATNLKFNVVETEAANGITLRRDTSLQEEAYMLNVNKEGIEMVADSYNGYFYALQSLMALLPADCYSPNGANMSSYNVECVAINDAPAFRWRGMHMDVSRHFLPKEFVLRFLDIMAMHKMNVFHWHLTDDQGWRLEIEKYPKLTEIGAWNVDRTDRPWNEGSPMKEGEKATYGGFYTKEDAREVVAYAAKRGITVVPEIEMPGHSWEVIASYPELGCSGKPQPVLSGGDYTGGTATLCAGNEKTYEVYQDIIDEVVEIFPSQYIHIGGDEANKTPWKSCPKCQKKIKDENLKDEKELQSYLITRMEKYIISKGRKMIGWDEILEGGIAPEATIMSWRGTQGGIAAAKEGHDVVMTPGSHLYFDMYQDTPEAEPAAIGGFTPISKVLSFSPIPQELAPTDSTPDLRKHVIGLQANTWCEYITTPEHFEYMTVPRIAAIAEVAWTGDGLGTDTFYERLYTKQMPRYDRMGINYHKGPGYVNFTTELSESDSCFNVTLASEIYGAEIAYTLDGTDPTVSSPRTDGTPLKITAPTVIKAVVIRGDSVYSKLPSTTLIGYHKGIGKEARFVNPYSKDYAGSGDNTLNNGATGTSDIRDGKSIGIANRDLDVIFDMVQVVEFNTVSAWFTQSIGVWAYLPEALVVSVSDDGKNFVEAGRTENSFDTKTQVLRKELTVKGNFKGRYIRVSAVNPITPEGLPGAGYKNWIFADEIFIL